MITQKRSTAFLLHLAFSSLLAAALVVWLFFVWYPGPLAKASGMQEIFLMLLGIDVVLGPLCTLLIYDAVKKQMAELKRDVGIILVLQIAAMLYGLYILGVARPAFIVFNAGQFDLVYANELVYPENNKGLKTPSFFGPQYIAAELPNDKEWAKEIIAEAVTGGRDVQNYPELYRPLEGFRKKIADVAVTVSDVSKFKNMNLEKGNKKVGLVPLYAKTKDLSVVVTKDKGDVLGIVSYPL